MNCQHCNTKSTELERDAFTDDLVCIDRTACQLRMVHSLSPLAFDYYSFLSILTMPMFMAWEIKHNERINQEII